MDDLLDDLREISKELELVGRPGLAGKTLATISAIEHFKKNNLASAVVSPGWKLVPTAPTDAMIKAAGSEWIPERLWRAMLAAAPNSTGGDAK